MNRTSGLRDLLPSPRVLLNSCPLGDSQHISLLFCMSIHWFHELLGYSPSYMKDFPSMSLWGSSLKLNILYVPLENTKNSGIYQVFKIFFLKLWNESPVSQSFIYRLCPWLITDHELAPGICKDKEWPHLPDTWFKVHVSTELPAPYEPYLSK